MLIDNKHELAFGQVKTIFQYLEANINEGGKFDFVTGYFTISALSKLSDTIRPQTNYRIILGDLFSLKPDRKILLILSIRSMR